MKQWYYEDFIDEKTKITVKVIKTNELEFKQGIKFAVSYLYFLNDKWMCLARIDNHLHKGKKGLTHIHRINEQQVQYTELTLKQASKMLKLIGENLKKGE